MKSEASCDHYYNSSRWEELGRRELETEGSGPLTPSLSTGLSSLQPSNADEHVKCEKKNKESSVVKQELYLLQYRACQPGSQQDAEDTAGELDQGAEGRLTRAWAATEEPRDDQALRARQWPVPTHA